MKYLLLTMTLISIVACGGSGGSSKNKKNPTSIVRDQLQGEEKITPEQALSDLKVNFSNQLNELYKNQSFEVKSNRTEAVLKTGDKEIRLCPFPPMKSPQWLILMMQLSRFM